MKNPATLFKPLLILLLGLFVIRVLLQLVQWIFPLPYLPAFDAWQSGALPYPLLLTLQLLIIAFCLTVIGRIQGQSWKPDHLAAKIYLSLGGIYFLVMLFRLTAGLTIAADHYWLGATLPAFFHLVLACFLLTLGFYHSADREQIGSRLIYPVILILALLAHYLCTWNQVNVLVSTYIPVLAAAALITFFEYSLPERQNWIPGLSDWRNDFIFMLVVQGLVPRFLGFLLVIGLAEHLASGDYVFRDIWPHQWPVVAQVILMLVSADFLRYWIHRLAHNWTPLWQLHAVHHSPHKLYWANVGRFHPLEKIIQYLFDAMPFILLAVSERVLAMYFVFYAVNGFFQHCNVKLRLGWLNYIVSGPELHRWHHSRRISESNNNYGNNLIIWDLVFNSRYLPANRQVEQLGLINRAYPLDFISQMRTPFRSGLDKQT